MASREVRVGSKSKGFIELIADARLYFLLRVVEVVRLDADDFFDERRGVDEFGLFLLSLTEALLFPAAFPRFPFPDFFLREAPEWSLGLFFANDIFNLSKSF